MYLWLRCYLDVLCIFFSLLKLILPIKKKCDADDRTCLLLKNVFNNYSKKLFK